MDKNRDKVYAVVLVFAWFVVFSLKFIFTMWPETKRESFFLYDPQKMSTQAYVDYFADCWTYIILSITMFLLMPKFREYLFYITMIWVGYFIEFKLMYNNPIMKFHGLPIGISLFLACVFGFLLIRSIVKIFI